VHRLEAALGGADADQPPGPDRFGKAFEALRTEVRQFEQPTYQPARRLTDDDTARRREPL
jgi:hypothetical protein